MMNNTMWVALAATVSMCAVCSPPSYAVEPKDMPAAVQSVTSEALDRLPASDVDKVPETVIMDPPEESAPQLDTTPAATMPDAAPPSSSGAAPMLNLGTTKIGIPVDRVGSYATIVPREEIRRLQPQSATDVLRRVPGVDVVRTGGLGNQTSIFMRGLQSKHTLVLLDGVELNNPMSPQRTVDFLDQIDVESIERIEVLRGPQGTLYGSDAMGGVINILTEPGEGPPTLTARIEGGSFNTTQGNFGLSGGLLENRLRYVFRFNRTDSQGFSSASTRYPGNNERDGFHEMGWMSHVTARPLDNVTLDLFSRFQNARTDLDLGNGAFQDDPNSTQRYVMFNLGGSARVKLFHDRVESISRFALANHYRTNHNPVDSTNPIDYSRNRFESRLGEVEEQINWYIHPSNTLTGGIEVESEKGESFSRTQYDFFGPNLSGSTFEDKTQTTVGYYLQDYIQLWDRWFTTLGIRLDHNDRFGNALTYKASTVYVVPKTKTSLRGSFSTGFKAPSLYELASQYGNSNLDPEKSIGWEAGVDQPMLGNRLRVGTTFFQNQVKDSILFVSNNTPPNFGRYENRKDIRSLGMENYIEYDPCKKVSFRGHFTWTHHRDMDLHEQLLRRPRTRWGINANFQPTEKLSFNIDLLRVGERDDQFFDPVTFAGGKVRLYGYTLLNATASYKVNEWLTVYGRVANLLDTPYEEVKGYGAPRISAYGGIRLSLAGHGKPKPPEKLSQNK